MSWASVYRGKIRSAVEAVATIQSGQTIYIHNGCGLPQTMVETLIAERERFREVRILTGLQGGRAPYARPEFAPHFRLQAFVPNREVRDAIRDGYADYIPCTLTQIPAFFKEGLIQRPDVAIVQLSPPDERGYCSLGVSVAYTKPAMEASRRIIAEVNAQMPRTLGDSFVHVSQIDMVVESDRPLQEVASAEVDDVLLAIGRNVAQLVPDRATVQVGVGNVSEGVWKALADHRDLGVHSGSLSDTIVDLLEAGVVTNRYKPIDRHKVVVGQFIATKKLFQYAHNNPAFHMAPVDYTHSLQTLSRLEGMISVNSALQVDLRGQVNSETLGGLQISGIGGSMEFTMGAYMAKGARNVIALPATAGEGKYSRIVPRIEGNAVTLPAALADCVATEYGLAELRGKSLRERARALIAIAAPRFREELERAAGSLPK